MSTTDDEVDGERSASFMITLTWDKTKFIDLEYTDFMADFRKALADTVECLPLEREAVSASGWWTGTIKSDTEEVITYRWQDAG